VAEERETRISMMEGVGILRIEGDQEGERLVVSRQNGREIVGDR